MTDRADPLQNSHTSLGVPDAPGGGWTSGQLVHVRGDRWRVDGGRRFPECEMLRLTGVGRTNRGRRIALLCPFDRPRRIEPVDRLRRVGWRPWLRTLRALLAAATPYGGLRCARQAKVDLLPYQLEPALAVLNGFATRVLLADAVGLGKTIQAGLLVAELLARDPAARTLVLTPAGLRDQWAAELRERFAIDAAVVDAAMVRVTLAQVAPGTNPWSVWPVIVASFDYVKRPEVLRALGPFTWDALVVDEAHLCASAPDRSAAMEALAARARRVVLLTATPHAGDDHAFAALCRIGRLPGRGTNDQRRVTNDQIVMFRRGRRDVGLPGTRRVHLLRVRCGEAERAMHRALARYTHIVWNSTGASSDARLAMIVLRKRAFSSATSLARSVERRLEALFDIPPAPSQIALPFGGSAEPDDRTPEDDEPARWLAAPGIEGPREREWLARVLDAARRAAGHEGKLRRLTRILARASQPAVVFTEYRDTARWLAAVLGRDGRVVLRPGGLSRPARQEAERRFRSGDARVMVATDAAGQGVNLHHRCRLVVNLELPWNPMRLEQRIGRVDRLGQSRRPHVIHLVGRGTAEESIVARLVLRQDRARRSIGCVEDAVGAVGEHGVAEAVMQEGRRIARRGLDWLSVPPGLATHTEPPGVDGFRTIDLRRPAFDEAVRVAGLRTMHPRVALRQRTRAGDGQLDAVDPNRPCVARLPRRRARGVSLRGGLVCVFVVRLVSEPDADLLERRIVALHCSVTGGAAEIAAGALDALVRSHSLKRRALAAAGEHMAMARDSHRRAARLALVRERTMVAMHRRSPVPVQPGMFDERALRLAADDLADRARREMEGLETVARLRRSASNPPVARADLALVLVVDRG